MAGAWIACIVASGGCEPRSSELRLGAIRSNLGAQSGQSQQTTWTCTSDPCPWGDETSNPAIAWPAEGEPVATRLGYSVSPAAYLPASSANGLRVTIDVGSAGVYVGAPQDSSHEQLAFLSEGDSFDVFGLDPDEVLSIQSGDDFTYHIAPFDPGELPDAGAPDPEAPDAGAPPDPPDAGVVDAPPPPDGPATPSQAVTWTCTGHQCPWGPTLDAHALVWNVERGAVATRLGYTASATVYLFGSRANGADIWIDSGTAQVQAGLPGDYDLRTLRTLHAGDSFHVTGVGFGEVLGVQSDTPFTYHLVLPPDSTGGLPGPSGPGTVMHAVESLWRCNVPDCFSSDWTGAVISWPPATAYQSNARPGNLSRSVFTWDDTPLYPYMGPWANGCEITGVSGITRVIEWQRGTDHWRDTWLYPGQSHVIHLVPPENGALIEGFDGAPGFSASVRNCNPQPLPP